MVCALTSRMMEPKYPETKPNHAMPRPYLVPTSRFRLLVLTRSAVSVHELPDNGSVVLGRADNVDIQIDDPSVSRTHARIHIDENFAVEDAGSANGTRLLCKALQIGERHAFLPGSGIEVGGALAIVQDSQAPSTLRLPSTFQASISGIPQIVDGRDEEALARAGLITELVAQSDINVTVVGETGSGKDALAESIHKLSRRSTLAFVKVNCAGLDETVSIRELFGLEKDEDGLIRPGRLESANGGTLYLDKVDSLPHSVQQKLLDTLRTQQLLREGGATPVSIDVRIIASCERELAHACELGLVSWSLYHFLSGISLELPSLRERPNEIPGLARAFVTEFAQRTGRLGYPAIAEDAMHALVQHRWSGNLRELRNVVERAMLLGVEGTIRVEHLPFGPAEDDQQDEGWHRERQRIMNSLAECSGNQTRAAKVLGMSRRTLVSRMVSHKIPRPHKPLKGMSDALPMAELAKVTAHLPDGAAGERERIIQALALCSGNQTRAAKLLRMSRRTLVSRMVSHSIPRPRKPLPKGRASSVL